MRKQERHIKVKGVEETNWLYQLILIYPKYFKAAASALRRSCVIFCVYWLHFPGGRPCMKGYIGL